MVSELGVIVRALWLRPNIPARLRYVCARGAETSFVGDVRYFAPRYRPIPARAGARLLIRHREVGQYAFGGLARGARIQISTLLNEIFLDKIKAISSASGVVMVWHAVAAHSGCIGMSAMGHKRTSCGVSGMSVFPRKRTNAGAVVVGLSAKCQQATSPLQRAQKYKEAANCGGLPFQW